MRIDLIGKCISSLMSRGNHTSYALCANKKQIEHIRMCCNSLINDKVPFKLKEKYAIRESMKSFCKHKNYLHHQNQA